MGWRLRSPFLAFISQIQLLVVFPAHALCKNTARPSSFITLQRTVSAFLRTGKKTIHAPVVMQLPASGMNALSSPRILHSAHRQEIITYLFCKTHTLPLFFPVKEEAPHTVAPQAVNTGQCPNLFPLASLERKLAHEFLALEVFLNVQDKALLNLETAAQRLQKLIDILQLPEYQLSHHVIL